MNIRSNANKKKLCSSILFIFCGDEDFDMLFQMKPKRNAPLRSKCPLLAKLLKSTVSTVSASKPPKPVETVDFNSFFPSFF